MSSKVYVYETVHGISRKICRSLVQGIPGAQLVPAITLLDGDMATYGILRGCHEILKQAQQEGRNWWYADHGYIGRSNHSQGDFGGYYRLTKNNYQFDGTGDCPSDRFDALGVELQPWKKKGEHVLLCPLSYNFSIHRGMDHKLWLENTIKEISKYTDRSILIKPKSSDMTLSEALMDAHCVVGYDTNALVDAVIHGVPVFNLGHSAAAPMALQDLSKIEEPIYPKRRQWCNNLAYNQFTLEEFRNGAAWGILQELYKDG